MTGSNEIFIGMISFIDVKCIVVDTQIYTSNCVEVFFLKIRYLRLTLK